MNWENILGVQTYKIRIFSSTCISGKKVTITLSLFIYERSKLLLLLLLCVCVCVCERERERERESDRQRTVKIRYLQIYTKLRYIFREACFFVLLSWETDLRPPLNPGPSAPLHHHGITPKTLCSHWLCWLLTDCSLLGVENFRRYIFFFLRNSRGISVVPCLP